MKKNIFYLFGMMVLLTFFLTACKPDTLDEDLIFRVDSLYEHTIIMEELSSKEILHEVNLDTSKIKRNSLLTTEDKIVLLEEGYRVIARGSYKSRVKRLEDTMVEMMYTWGELVNEKNDI